MKFLLFALVSIFLGGCVNFADGEKQSVWSEALWILPWLTGLAALWFLYTAWRGSKSNSTQQTPGGIRDNTGNVPIWKSGRFFWFFIILAVATIVIIISVISNR